MRFYRITFSLVYSLVCGILSLQAQQVGIGTTQPAASAVLEVQATDKGMLIPRLSTLQRNAIVSPDRGLLVFDTDKGTFFFYDGFKWRALGFINENQVSLQSRTAADPLAGAGFGSPVDISGNYAIAGAKNWGSSSMLNRGTAYIFYKGTNGWQQQARLLPGDSATNDLFGGDVAICGDFAAVAAPTKQGGRGKVYLFKRTDTNWNLETTLTRNGTAASGDNFGFGLDLGYTANGTLILAVGVPLADLNGTDRGEVQLFTRNVNGNWSFLQSLQPANVANNDQFGQTISIDSNYLAVAAPYQDVSGSVNAGAVYLYQYNGSNYTQQQQLTGITGGAGYGLSLSMHGPLLAVGAPLAALFANTSPAVYTYRRGASSWTQTNQIYVLNPPTEMLNGVFGMSVAILPGKLLVGIPGGIDFPNGTGVNYAGVTGSVYYYESNSDVFSGNPARTFQAENPTTGDFFGQWLSLDPSGNYIIGSGKEKANGFSNAGQIYFGF